MLTATLSNTGQVTLPLQVRQALGVKPGDCLHFTVEPSGQVRVHAAADDVRALKGLLRRTGRQPVTPQQMERAIGRQGRRE